MALPWTAPGYGQGIFPSRAPFFIPETVDPRLVASIAAQREQNQQQIAGAIQGAISGLGQMIEQRRQDAIASQLLAGSAPQAEAFTPAGEPTPTGTPSAALSAAEIAQNKALGYPTQQLMRPSEIYASTQQLANQHLSDLYKAAQIEHLNRLGYGTGGAGGATADRYVWVQSPTGQKFKVTGNEAAKLTTGGSGFAGAAEVKRGWEKPDGTFTNKADEAGVPQGTPFTQVQVMFPRAKSPTVLPAGTWDSLKNATGWKVIGGESGGGGTNAQDARAIEWAKSNPNDPRAQKILAANGL
jgi:hypothetical protein